jgi:hypothetical protein
MRGVLAGLLMVGHSFGTRGMGDLVVMRMGRP